MAPLPTKQIMQTKGKIQMRFKLTTSCLIAAALLAGCGKDVDPQAQAYAAIKAQSPRAIQINDKFYGPADAPYEQFPTVVMQRRDQLGHIWTATLINFSPLIVRSNRLIIYVGTHAATGVQRHEDNHVLVRWGPDELGLNPDTWVDEWRIKVVDVDEAHHTLVMEQFYELSPKKYLEHASAG
ncbi:hypothetical protein [Paraburkholderia pallida]|uniref:Uncharacterized protein n=1 Tax=Paraburkholderia pallida TaxID=2547399 RepID=A0A4P7CU14_9BURK|nr:hypothetical protein [Paraburkholderia pallida]QBQ99510.1 hypothetical protein E1956_20250 [Paraburkholderia pallida]